MAETPPHIVFHIPAALAETTPHASSPHPCLETFVARGDTAQTGGGGDGQLLALFGGDVAHGSARAAVCHHAQHGSRELDQWRIIASPVHLLADHATLHFPPQQHLCLSDEESRALIASCQEYFAEEGWQLEYGDATMWYLRVNRMSSIITTPLAEAVGKLLFDVLPQGSDARLWRRWINEAQMLFHTHAVNNARQTRGEPAINTLWFWGEGHLPALSTQRFGRVYGGDRYVQGLAQLSGAQWAPLPERMTAMELPSRQNVLVVLDEAPHSSWDTQWFCALSSKLRDKSMIAATLQFRNGYTTHLTRKHLWRLWRRKRFTVESAS